MSKRMLLAILISTMLLTIITYSIYRLCFYEPLVLNTSLYEFNDMNRGISDAHKSYERFIASAIIFVCAVVSFFIVLTLEYTTEWITPTLVSELVLIRKEMDFRPMGGMGFGNVCTFKFWFEDSKGSEFRFEGHEKEYALLMEGNVIKLSTKKSVIRDFEILSVE